MTSKGIVATAFYRENNEKHVKLAKYVFSPKNMFFQAE